MLCIDFITYKHVNKFFNLLRFLAHMLYSKKLLIIFQNQNKSSQKTLYNQIFTWIDIMSLISYWFQLDVTHDWVRLGKNCMINIIDVLVFIYIYKFMYCTMTYEITMNFPHHLPTTNPCSL